MEKLFLLVELTCTVQTLKDGWTGTDADDYGVTGGARRGGGRRGNNNDAEEGAVRGPLKNFRAGGGRKRRQRGARGGGKGRGDNLDFSGEGSSEDDSGGSEVSCRLGGCWWEMNAVFSRWLAYYAATPYVIVVEPKLLRVVGRNGRGKMKHYNTAVKKTLILPTHPLDLVPPHVANYLL